jgi:hypothetical protein
MTLLAPLGLLALLALPVIVILHMLRERRRRVVVPSLLLWQLLPRRQEAQRRRRLPLTLLLLLHLLAAVLLAFALARPEWPLDLFGSNASLALIVDTSTSMAAPSGVGTRLDAARARARELLGAGGNVTLIDAGTQARVLDAGGLDAATRLAAALETLVPSGTGTDIDGALTLAEAALQGQPAPRIVVLTDAALPALEAELDGRDGTVPVAWETVGSPIENRAVVTLAARVRSGTSPVQVYARAVNYSENSISTVLRLYGDEQILDTRPVTFNSNSEAELTWAVPRDIELLRVELDGEDGLPADDSYTISLAATRPVRALLVSARPAALERALRAVPGLELNTIDPSAYSGSDAELTIFEGFLPDRWPEGGVLAVSPPVGSTLLAVNDGEREAADAALQVGPSSLLDGVSLSSVAFGAVRGVTPPEGFQTLLSRDEQPLILRGRQERSEIAVWSFDLGQGNLTSRLAFPLLVARSVRDLTPPALQSSALLGEMVALHPDPRAERVEVGTPDGSVMILDVTLGEPLELRLEVPGVYNIAERAGERTLFEGRIGVNAGAAVESDLRPRPVPEAPPPPAAAFSADANQRPLWPWLAAAALLVMLVEWLYVHGRRRTVAEA